MARIRTIKPELYRHEGLQKLEKQSGLPIRLAFTGMFTVADRAGRFKWRPAALKLDVVPYDDDFAFEDILDALASHGFIEKYEVDGELYGWIPKFNQHQVINNKERLSDLPDPLGKNVNKIDIPFVIKYVATREPRVTNAIPETANSDKGEGKGKGREKEGKGKGTVDPVHASNSGTKVVAIAPTSEKKSNHVHDLITHWKAAFKARYLDEPHATGSAWGAARSILNAVPIEHAKLLVTAYLEMNDSWFLTKRHDLPTLLGNINAVQVYLGTGLTLSRLQISQAEKLEETISQIERIERGLV